MNLKFKLFGVVYPKHKPMRRIIKTFDTLHELKTEIQRLADFLERDRDFQSITGDDHRIVLKSSKNGGYGDLYCIIIIK